MKMEKFYPKKKHHLQESNKDIQGDETMQVAYVTVDSLHPFLEFYVLPELIDGVAVTRFSYSYAKSSMVSANSFAGPV